ncbi:histidine kinase dimerization/phosphoacceptor domain -containing protein [Ekhidna sp.]|uniref:sensor histidine kinase n=1 Tax=Ekhidna sp. TaxID=2608089 RepID=UPI0032EF66AD
MKYIHTFFFTIGACLVFAQNQTLIDSLRNSLEGSSQAEKQQLLLDLSWEFAYSDIDSGEYYGLRGLELAKERNLPDEIAKAKSMLAIVYDIQGKVEESALLYLDVAKFYETNNNQAELSKTYNNLGVLFYYNGDTEKSFEYYKKSIDIDAALGDSLGVARSLINLAAIANTYGEWEKAFRYLKRGEKIAVFQDENGEVIRAINEALANNYIYQYKYDSALIYLNKAIRAFKQVGDNHSILSNLNGMIIVWRELGNYTKAENYLIEAEDLATIYDDQYLRKKRNEIAAELFDKKGDYQKAYSYLTKYLADNDSITSNERIRITSELEEKYQAEQKENEIAQLQIQQQQSKNQRNVLLLISALVVMGAIMLYILFRSKSKANAIISKSLAEKETLLKEIHHRVKNNLQVVSSLLSMQSRFITDKNALGAVNEGQSRVESMALIHQKLYQENNLSGVNAKEYIEDLAEILKNSYRTDSTIEFKYDVEDLTIDVDTIIPIGLILNELICNSLKHAYPNESEGTISIKLKEENKQLHLAVTDNGVGSSGESSEKSFGMVLIDSLALKLKATLQITSDKGTSTILNINKYKLV